KHLETFSWQYHFSSYLVGWTNTDPKSTKPWRPSPGVENAVGYRTFVQVRANDWHIKGIWKITSGKKLADWKIEGVGAGDRAPTIALTKGKDYPSAVSSAGIVEVRPPRPPEVGVLYAR